MVGDSEGSETVLQEQEGIDAGVPISQEETDAKDAAAEEDDGEFWGGEGEGEGGGEDEDEDNNDEEREREQEDEEEDEDGDEDREDDDEDREGDYDDMMEEDAQMEALDEEDLEDMNMEEPEETALPRDSSGLPGARPSLVLAVQAERLSGLNPQQREAVTAPLGPVLVVAGPGSGKTRVLTERVCFLVRNGVPPNTIMALTFTKKAAEEMRERIRVGLGVAPEETLGVHVRTIHSQCSYMLRVWGVQAGVVQEGYKIADRNTCERAMAKAIKKQGLSLTFLKFMMAKVQRLKGMGISGLEGEEVVASALESLAGTPAQEEEVGENRWLKKVRQVIHEYATVLDSNNELDFDDLELLTERMLLGSSYLLRQVRRRWRHVLIDEFQDCKPVEYRLMQLFAGRGGAGDRMPSVFAVGDPDQNIYSFRNPERFIGDYRQRNAVCVVLGQNYRSTPRLVEFSERIMSRSSQARPHDKKGFSLSADKGSRPILSQYKDSESEAAGVTKHVRGLISGGVEASQVAVLYRNNFQSRALEDELLRQGVRYIIARGTPFFGRTEVQDLVAYVRLLADPGDMGSLKRIINTPPRGIGRKCREALFSISERFDVHPFDILLGMSASARLPEEGAKGKKRGASKGEGKGMGSKKGSEQGGDAGEERGGLNGFDEVLRGFKTVQRTRLRGFVALMREVQQRSKEDASAGLLSFLVEKIGYREYLERVFPKDWEARWENVQELIRLASMTQEGEAGECSEGGVGGGGVEMFLGKVIPDGKAAGRDPDGVQLMTIHAAKGLEFEAVCVVGAEESMLPYKQQLRTREGIESERRLLYVGVTRAKRHLHLSWCRERLMLLQDDKGLPVRPKGRVAAGGGVDGVQCTVAVPTKGLSRFLVELGEGEFDMKGGTRKCFRLCEEAREWEV